MFLLSLSLDPASTASTLELLLITVAVVISAFLSLAPSSRDRARTRGVGTPLAFTVVSLIFAASALILSIAITVLAWVHTISLDAFASTIFVLIPALINMPIDLLYDLQFRIVRSRHPSLAVTRDNFCYVRIGRHCSSSYSLKGWKQVFPHCRGRKCTAHIFVRYVPRQPASVLRSSRPAIQPPETRTTNTQWHGIRVGHSRHVIKLRDFNHGLKMWWWNSIMSASWLVSKPSLVRLHSSDIIINALTLLADIVRVGDIILECRRSFFQWQLKNNEGLIKGITATPGSVCNLLLSQLGLTEWGQVTPKFLEEDSYPTGIAEEYGLLFYILTEKSQMYATEVMEFPVNSLDSDGAEVEVHNEGDTTDRQDTHTSIRLSQEIVTYNENVGCYIIRKEHRSANEIVECLEKREFPSYEKLMDKVNDLIDDWLVSWGISRQSLKSFDALV